MFKVSFITLLALPLWSLADAAAVPTPTTIPAKPVIEITTVATNADGIKMVADSMGRTLYIFDVDKNKPAPACNGDCAEVWPPYLLDAKEVADLKAPLSSVLRANKKLQLTIDGMPVYTYAFDRSLGDDSGDGIGRVWHTIVIKDE